MNRNEEMAIKSIIGTACACLLGVSLYLLPSVSWSATIYSVGGTNAVPSNTVDFSSDTLITPADFTIGGVKLTATFSPGQTSGGTVTIPLQAGSVWLELTRLAVGEADTVIRLFDFPGTYPTLSGNPSCSAGGPFDHSCINTELNGSYIFDDSATADFDSSTIAAIDGVLAPGAYQSSIASLDALIGLRGNDATYRISAASTSSGTKGSVDWQLELTAVPVPAAVWSFGSGLIGLLGVARRKKA
jgi:hypothetical protein